MVNAAVEAEWYAKTSCTSRMQHKGKVGLRGGWRRTVDHFETPLCPPTTSRLKSELYADDLSYNKSMAVYDIAAEEWSVRRLK